MNKETRNSEALNSFVGYCVAHPDQRFFQALTNWSGLPWVGWAESPSIKGFHDLWNEEVILRTGEETTEPINKKAPDLN